MRALICRVVAGSPVFHYAIPVIAFKPTQSTNRKVMENITTTYLRVHYIAHLYILCMNRYVRVCYLRQSKDCLPQVRCHSKLQIPHLSSMPKNTSMNTQTPSHSAAAIQRHAYSHITLLIWSPNASS